MNEKIPVNRLAQEVAGTVGASPAEVQQFIKDLFAYVEAEVSAGNDVEVPGLGRFSKSTISGEPIAFVPDAEYAAALNADFEMFTPVELNDGVTEEDLENAVRDISPEPTQQHVAEPEPEDEPETSVGQVSEPDNTPAEIQAETPEPVPSEEISVVETQVIVENAEPTESAENSQAEQIEVKEETTEIAAEPVTDAKTDNQTEVEAKQTETDVPTDIRTAEPLITAIPEQEEEYVIVHGRKSRFWLGFIIGLVLGFALGVIAFVAYLVNISVITPEKLFN